MKIALGIRTQMEYELARKYVENRGILCGYDEMFKNGIIYVIDTKEKTLLVGFDKEIPEMKKQGYKFTEAKEFFKDKLKSIKKYKVIRIWYVNAFNHDDALKRTKNWKHHDNQTIRLDTYPPGIRLKCK
jgi:hypothetical protein